jgi:glycosyltransferase involved in cell wall biosynthesis
MKVFGFHDNSACGYLRVTLPLDMLAHQGWQIQTAVGWDDRALDYPLVVGQRVGKPEALPLWQGMKALDQKLVYETDDDMWSIDETNFRALQEHSPLLLDAASEAIRVAHLVTVSTAPLGEVVGQFNPNVAVLPNHIDGRMLDLERPRRGRLVVGWAGGDSHMKDIQVLAPHLKRFLRKNPQVEFHNIGTDFCRVFGIPARWTGWNDVWDYYRTIDFDIGLAPLAPIRFNRSKSHIKALEYAALGIPTIASDEPPYRDFVLHGVTGYLVRRDHEWGQYLRELVNDAGLRESMGRKAREHAAEFTIQRGWRLWADAYESLLEGSA